MPDQFELLEACPTTGGNWNFYLCRISSAINFLTLAQATQRALIMDAIPVSTDQFGRRLSFYHDTGFEAWIYLVFPTAPTFTGTPQEKLEAAEDWKVNTWDPAHPEEFRNDWGPPMTVLGDYGQEGNADPELFMAQSGRSQSFIGDPPTTRRCAIADVPRSGYQVPSRWKLFQESIHIVHTGGPSSEQGGTSYVLTRADIYDVPFLPMSNPIPTETRVPEYRISDVVW